MIFKLDSELIASASLRAGYLMTQDTLLYVIGGYSHGEFDVGNDTGTFDLPDVSSDGFHAGAGMETRLTDRLTARIEYRYTEFGGEELIDNVPGTDAEVSAHTHTGTLGLAYNLFPTAGDGEAVSPAADVVEPMVSWTGPYIGLSGGAGAFVAERFTASNEFFTAGGEGFLGSAFAGYNWQAGDRFVLGLEGAIGLGDADWDLHEDLISPGILTFIAELGAELDWFASASLRAGWRARKP